MTMADVVGRVSMTCRGRQQLSACDLWQAGATIARRGDVRKWLPAQNG